MLRLYGRGSNLMKPLLMMRTKGITGPAFANHTGIRGLSKSVGNSIGGVRAIAGWAGNPNCTGDGTGVVTVNFSDDVTYTNGTTGVSVTHSNGGVFTLGSASGNGTSQLAYTGSWNIEPVHGDSILWSYDADTGDYVDGESEPLISQTFRLVNCTSLVLEVLSYSVTQIDTPNGDTINRSQGIDVVFNQYVTATKAGVTATVHGAEQFVVISGSGTDTLRYTLQRAIFKHDVTWAYDAVLGDITSGSGEELSSVPEFTVTNLLPEFTTWDYNISAPNSYTDTLWDNDGTRFDED